VSLFAHFHDGKRALVGSRWLRVGKGCPGLGRGLRPAAKGKPLSGGPEELDESAAGNLQMNAMFSSAIRKGADQQCLEGLCHQK